MDADGFRDAISAESTEPRKIRAFAALLGRESGLGSDGLTVVGGSALEIYTDGAYISQDVDLVAENPSSVESVLSRWGFVHEGMYWSSPDFPLAVQMVGRYDSGSRQRNQLVATRYGRVRLASIEDVVVMRVIESRYWNRPKAFAEAVLGVERYGNRMDWDYVMRIAKQDRVDNLVPELRRRAGAGPASGTEAASDVRKD